MGGSMGSAVGEKFARAASAPRSGACRSSASRPRVAPGCRRGSSRSCSCRRRSARSIPCARRRRRSIVVMTHPTTAGVLASFASLGDVIVAEPGALLSFTGPRVVQQTTREKLPEDFGLAESNARFGHVDAILARRPISAPSSVASSRSSTMAAGRKPRRRARSSSSACASGWRSCGDAPSPPGCWSFGRACEVSSGRSSGSRPSRRRTRSGTPVELARHQNRPYTLDYVERMFDDFVELHGDRCVGRRPGHRRRARPLRRPDGRLDRPPEGPRHPRADAPELRHGAIRRATARRCGSWSWPTATASRCSRSSTRPAPIRASRPSSTAREAGSPASQLAMARLPRPVGRLRHRRGRLRRRARDRASPTACSCRRTRSTRSSRPRAAPPSCGATPARRRKQQRRSSRTRRTVSSWA